MNNLAILSGAKSMEQLRKLIPVAYKFGKIPHEQIVECALAKGRILGDQIELAELGNYLDTLAGRDAVTPANKIEGEDKSKNQTLLPPAHISGISAADLATKIFQPLKWIVDGVLPEGSYLLSARPKVGKSWLALQICLAVAYGDMLWGRQVKQGVAVYLALEENQRRLQKRLGQLRRVCDTPHLLLYTEWKRSDQGGLDDLEKLLADKKPRLVVIDTLAKIRAPSGRNGSAYEGDYQALAPITAMANKYRCCIVIVTHNRKGKSEGDATEMVSGTLGQMGAVDGALVIDGNRGDDTMKLTLVGRDIEEDGEFAIKKLPQGGWDWLGKADEVFISTERKAIIDLLKLGSLKPKEIAERLGKPPATVRKLLFTMLANSQVTTDADGRYASP